MVTYVYVVKCPECDDEFFDFFAEAKDFAMGCLTKKPVITQTEVNRNDFGECTDHCDLGQVWSWEDVMKETDAEPAVSVFSKDDLKHMANGEDPEFDSIDNSVDFEPVTSEVSPVDEVPDNFKKPVPADMTIESLVETLEENEDEVECKTCFNLFPKADCSKHEHGYVCPTCGRGFESTTSVEATIDTLVADEVEAIEGYEVADEVVQHADIDEDKKDQILDTLEHIKKEEEEHIDELVELTAEETPITDEVDSTVLQEDEDDLEVNEDTVECTWCEELYDKSECRYEVDLGWLCSRCEMAIKSRGETLTFKENNYWDFLDEKLDLDIDFSQVIDSSDMEIWGIEPVGEDTYKAVLLKRFENVSFKGSDEIEKVESEMFDLNGLFVFHFNKDGMPELGRWDPYMLSSLGQCEIIFEDDRYDQACERTFNRSAYDTEEPKEVHDLGNEYDGGYPEEELQEEAPVDRAAWKAKRKELLNKKVEFYYEDIDYTYTTTVDSVIDKLAELVTDPEVEKYSKGRFKDLDEISDYDYEEYLKNKDQKDYWQNIAYSEWTALLENNFDELFAAHEDELYDAFREAAVEEAGIEAEEAARDPREDPDGFYGWSDYYTWKNGPISDFNRR